MADEPDFNYPLSDLDGQLEEQACRMCKAVLKTIRDNGDNLAILATIRRELWRDMAGFVEDITRGGH